MKRITCTLCGGTGVAYEVPDPVEVPKQKIVPALEKQLSLDLGPTPEEEEAWKYIERTVVHTYVNPLKS